MCSMCLDFKSHRFAVSAVISVGLLALCVVLLKGHSTTPRMPTEIVVHANAPIAAAIAPASPNTLRVCADPNNMPFSNAAGEGFENRIAEMAAKKLGLVLQYYWKPQRRGF